METGNLQKRRVFRFPIVRRADRCGYCKECLNPLLKAACSTRRKELMAEMAFENPDLIT